MELALSFSFFILGAILASFMGVVTGRLHTGDSFLRGRSRCDACDAPLSFFALIPILSYVASAGRAQCCGARISLLAPITEVTLGGLFTLSYLTLDLTPALPFMLIALSLLQGLVVYDMAHQVLPYQLLYLFVIMSAISGYLSATSSSMFFSTLPTACLIPASLAALHFFSRGRAMGFADAPLSFGLALLTGTSAFPGFIFSFWIGAVVGIGLLFQRPRGSRMGVEVPFAPFLATGFLLAYFTKWNPYMLITLLS